MTLLTVEIGLRDVFALVREWRGLVAVGPEHKQQEAAEFERLGKCLGGCYG